MVRTIVTACLALGALTAPAAEAAHAEHDCRFVAAASIVTGPSYSGVLYGHVASPAPGETVSLRCDVVVDGVVTSVTHTATGVQATAVVAPVTFSLADEQAVRLCHAWAAGPESGYDCRETSRAQVPPQEVADLLNDIWAVTDLLHCPVLATLSPGVPGVVDIEHDGDVSVNGSGVWECPPYDDGDPDGWPPVSVIRA